MKIRFCGYSYHAKKYHTAHRSGLASYLFRLQTDGIAEVTVKGKKSRIKKGDLLIVKPSEKYELWVDEGNKSGDFHLLCEGEWIDNLFRDSPAITKIELEDTLISLWHHIILEERRPKKEQNEELSHYLLKALSISLKRLIDDRATNYHRPYVVTRMMRYIEEHATTPGFRLEDVAKHCDLSVSRCVHLFKENLAKTMLDYAQEIRISAALNQMKYTTMTLETISDNCGFGSYSYFHRVFKKYHGKAPNEVRNKL
ncbi:helix-turn-helix transcriptional regulator [Saliterribacillus persicus]|uniref:AraC family transcriptional regulator n=1 Tax=Saliterribacillus persicus TaxID=930114 RepID=A0A368Y3H2_9BACI|nr:AraC family transcriptional regulator [Saliterribacillus persicus]RCW74850.1 AraC family transcriptional regulator [Saliterribacillus persicus]